VVGGPINGGGFDFRSLLGNARAETILYALCDMKRLDAWARQLDEFVSSNRTRSWRGRILIDLPELVAPPPKDVAAKVQNIAARQALNIDRVAVILPVYSVAGI
jgi:hypothetical protein